MKRNCEFVTILKLQDFAESLPDNVDFIDYWYNFSISPTKERIDSSIWENINAFDWTRWQEDFEEYVTAYKPKFGAGYSKEMRSWFAQYTQYLTEAFDLPSKEIFEFYGLNGCIRIMEMYSEYHCYGIDHFIENVALELGKPDCISKINLVYF